MFDIWTLVLVMPALGFSFLVRQRCMSTLKRYSQVAAKSGQTGQQIADRMLELNNLSGGTVPIRAVEGAWSDHFARGKKAQNGKVPQWIGLSEPVHGVASISATAVAAHEVGHAIQFNSGYKLMKLRTAIRPVSTFGSRFGPWIASMGIMFGFGPLLNIGIVLFSGAVLFSLLTLPSELNASSRALAILRDNNMIAPDEIPGARKALNAAAMTYFAALLVNCMHLIRLILLSRRRGRRR